jgi:predicted enzyme related to lactoylglutathione lyase
MNKIVHFEIVAEDTARAINFYSKVFGWEIKKVGGGEMDYWLINSSPANTPGAINGGLRKEMGIDKKEQTRSINAFICTIEVQKIDETLSKIEEQGGKIMRPKMPVHGVGLLAYCLDSEGNIFSVLEPEKRG